MQVGTSAWNIGEIIVNKWSSWLDSQNDATRAYFETQMKNDNPIIYMSMGIGFLFGFIVGALVLL